MKKLKPKFSFDKENEFKNYSKNNKINYDNQYFKHNYTYSEFEFLKTEEKVPQNEILVQTRSLTKEYCPGYLSAVSGGVLFLLFICF